MSARSTWPVVADRLGIVASSLCFLHCLAAPILLSVSAVYAHFLPSEERSHRVLAIVVTLIGVLAVGNGYRRHRRVLVLLFTAAGLGVIVAAAAFGDRLPHHWNEVALTLVGSCCMIAAHRLNHTFCTCCTRCDVELATQSDLC